MTDASTARTLPQSHSAARARDLRAVAVVGIGVLLILAVTGQLGWIAAVLGAGVILLAATLWFYGTVGAMTEAANDPDAAMLAARRVAEQEKAFRVSLVQALPFEGRISFKPVISSDNNQWSIKGILTNSTSLRLAKARILYKGSFGEVGDIGPGQTKKIEVRFPKSATSQWEGEAPPPIGNAMALSARAEGLKVGTDLGAEPKDKRGCKIVYTWSQK